MALTSDSSAMMQSLSDPAAFETIFDRHFDAIYRFFRRRVSQPLADDLTAEVFVRAFARRHVYDSKRPDARPWLFGFAVNVLRRHSRDEERELRAFARTGVDPIAFEEPRFGGVYTSDYMKVSSILADLDGADRDALLLFAWADLSYDEIGEIFAVPEGTVKSRIHRARKRIRAALSDIDVEASRGEAADG